MNISNKSLTTQRQSNFELLRIVSMILIVCHHYAYHGGFKLNESTFYLNNYIVQVLFYGGKLGVNIFVLISGYFLITSEFKMKKAVLLWLKVTIYSTAIALIFYLVGYSISMKEWKYIILPVLYNSYWFATTYFVMYILSNYINKFIESLDKKDLLKVICILVTILSVLPTFVKSNMATSKFFWFFLLYLIAAYIRLYDPEIFKKKGYICISVALYTICLLSCIVLSYFKKDPFYFAGMNTITMLLISVFLLVGFKNINIGYSKIINKIAASTFGVYLIHDNVFMRKYLWHELFKNLQYYYSEYLILHAIITITIVYVVCTLIDILYIHVIEKFIYKLLNLVWWRFEALWKVIVKTFKNYITL